jgi:acetoin utilization deacetylase AcuC-like enzyme
MRVSFHPDYRVDLPPTHPYPMGKYPLLHRDLLASGLIDPSQVMEPIEAPLEMLARVHDRDYLDRLAQGTLAPGDVRRLGVPVTPRLWRRSRLAAHGTYLAAKAALTDGLAANLAGGTHHAYADHGEGFCALNDVAIAIRALQEESKLGPVLVADLDVHQGNGTAAIFAQDPEVLTLSIHGERNYPLRKERSTWDIGLADGTGDAEYLEHVDRALTVALETVTPSLVFFIAGVDVVAGDHYGRLALSVDGLRRREACVIRRVRERGIPLCIVLGGGYAPTTLRTAELHRIVFEEAIARWRLERS